MYTKRVHGENNTNVGNKRRGRAALKTGTRNWSHPSWYHTRLLRLEYVEAVMWRQIAWTGNLMITDRRPTATSVRQQVSCNKTNGITLSLALSISTAIFSGEPGLAGFTEAKDDRNGGDKWSYKSCSMNSVKQDYHLLLLLSVFVSVAQ